MSTQPSRSRPESDLDRTDELPALDLTRITGTERGEIDDDALSATDTWLVPALPASEAAPAVAAPVDTAAAKAEPAAPVQAVQQEAPASPPAAAGNDASSIFETIRSLEANLHAHAERETRLKAQMERALAERAAFERDMGEMQRRSDAQLEALQTLETRRRFHDDALFEMENEVQAHAQRAAAVEAQIRERDAEIATLKAQLKEEHTRVTTLEVNKDAQVTQLQGESAKKATEIATLASQKDELQRKLTSQIQVLEADLREKSAQLGDTQRVIAEQAVQIRTLQETLVTRDTAVGRLEAELKNSNEIIGSIQRDIRRLSGDAPILEQHTAPLAAPSTMASASAAPEVRPRRVLIQLDCEPEVTHVLDKPSLTIGRTGESDLSLDTKFTSRNHARIVSGPTFVVLEDLGSTNGSYINGRRVKRRHTLADGDIVTIGKTRFRFAIQKEV